jgi:hypothetical protein
MITLELARKPLPTYKTRLYRIYVNMKGRCNKQYNSRYNIYGARGVRVCGEWQNNFETFKKWAVENGYSDNLTLDRKDNNGDYAPNNCRWVDRIIQANNTRVNRLITIDGETHTIAEWSRITGLSRDVIKYRLLSGWKGRELIIPLIPKGGDRKHKASKERLINLRKEMAQNLERSQP